MHLRMQAFTHSSHRFQRADPGLIAPAPAAKPQAQRELLVGPAASPLPVLRSRVRPGFGVALRSVGPTAPTLEVRRERARPGLRSGVLLSCPPRPPWPARRALDPDIPEDARATGGEGGGAAGGRPTP